MLPEELTKTCFDANYLLKTLITHNFHQILLLLTGSSGI